MDIRINFKGNKMYKRGVTDISEPWNSKGQIDKYTYDFKEEK